MPLAQRALALTGSQTSGMRNRARKLQGQGVHVINFAAGELDRDTSPIIKDAVRRAVDSGQTRYSDTLGIRQLREQLAARVIRKTGVAYAPEEVGFTAGAKQALFNAAFVCFQPGDEVIIPAPYWVTFPEQVRLAGATPVFLPTADNNFQIDIDALAGLITPRTRGLILNTPHNPTGVVYGAGILEKVARLAIEHDITCIFDECYDELVYAPAHHVNIVKLVPEMKARTILVGSFSKTYCMAGWRAGFVAGPLPVIKAIANLQSHTASNASNLVQYAALAAMEPGNDAFVADVREQLGFQRETALQLLGRIPSVTCVIPTGAFYLFPDVRGLLNRSFAGQKIQTVEELAEVLLEHAHIAVVPGSAFGSDRHVRISYAIPRPDIITGLTSLERFVQALA
ncbi:MAG TPA: pyridoxal phosphate-dependent aminotransferase [Tepidisphaeraceae bacterium]|nr:pyridoxal phosphate-dependent aminotransferase [Tepidisphaeraceae bacterium]